MSAAASQEAREHAQEADPGHQHHAAASGATSWHERLRSATAWSDVAHNFRGDWQMVWKEIGIGFLLADLIMLPIVAIYRKYYGTRFALRITALTVVTMIVAALIVAGIFDLLGAIPSVLAYEAPLMPEPPKRL